MILLEISDIKLAMAHLLIRDSFDLFYLDSAELTTFATMSLRGRRNFAWYDSDERRENHSLSEWVRWSEVKTTVFSYIKGTKTPDAMKIILKADAGWARSELAKQGLEAQYQRQHPELIINFRYEKETLSVVTGISYTEFTMDKQIEYAWDDIISHYFSLLGIALF